MNRCQAAAKRSWRPLGPPVDGAFLDLGRSEEQLRGGPGEIGLGAQFLPVGCAHLAAVDELVAVGGVYVANHVAIAGHVDEHGPLRDVEVRDLVVGTRERRL